MRAVDALQMQRLNPGSGLNEANAVIRSFNWTTERERQLALSICEQAWILGYGEGVLAGVVRQQILGEQQ